MPRTLHATLIGINTYPERPLAGCILDVLAIDQLLREQCAQQSETLLYNPLYLLAPNEADEERITRYNEGKSKPVAFETPSFDNISQEAFAHLKQAKDGDICVFYYSGHGSQTDAPEVFWHTKPDRQNETIVCVDSRDPEVPEARDLIDKEMAFLLWDALKGKDVHALVIMDSCHSGSNTREIADGTDTGRYRFQPSAKTRIPFEDYIGFGQGDFYDIKEGNARIQIARYVHLAAARDSEKAREVREGGLFTSQLIKLLQSGGTSQSYRDLMQSVAVTVRNHNQQQNPVAYAREEADMNLQFLGEGMVPYKPSFEVRYKPTTDQWVLSGGSLHGLTPSSGSANTTIKITGGDAPDREIRVTQVFSDWAILDKTGMENFDKARLDYKAVVVRLANAAFKVGLSPTLLADGRLVSQLTTAYNHGIFPFIELVPQNSTEVSYLIQKTSDNTFILTRSNSAIPLFKREKKADVFLQQVDQFGKWLHTLEIKNAVTTFKKGDFVFALERIEGQPLPSVNREEVSGEKRNLSPDDEIVFSYVNNEQPAFRLSISIAPDSTLKSCFVGALYLDSMYGIFSGFISSDSSQLVKNGSPLTLELEMNSRATKTIGLQIDPLYSLYNVNEITDYLKIFVSSSPLDLSRHEQESLELDPEPTRAISKGFVTQTPVETQTDWTVFDFKFRIIGPNKEKTLVPGTTTDFSLFSIETPEGFSAQAFAATNDDLLRKQRAAKPRGVDEVADVQLNSMMPSDTFWGDTITEAAFSAGLATGSDNRVQVIELRSVDGKPLVLPEGKSLLIRPADLATGSKDLGDDLEEVIIPCGFDEESNMLYPIGSSDENGIVHIDFLPPETPDLVQAEELGAKSVGVSVKMFFKKLFRRKKGFNSLVLYEIKKDGTWEEITDKPNKIGKELKNKPNAQVLLLTHGLTGDTGPMVAAMKELDGLPDLADFVLTYDYENLSTPIDEAGETLHKILSDIGFGNSNFPEITIIAHSQGCLLSRWMVEQAGGDAYVKHLILVAGASAGSELAQLGTTIFSLLTHALNVTGPIKLAIKGLTFLLKALKSDPGRTLKDTAPGSGFITKLGASRQAEGVRYSVIIGNLELIDRDFNEDDTFLQNLKRVLAKKVVVPWFTHGLFADQLNDIAVTHLSAGSINGYNANNTRIVASNHLAYFRKNLAEKELMALLQSGDA